MRFPTFLLALPIAALFAVTTPAQAEFKAGAALTDITPETFPVLINGGFTSRTADEVTLPISARSLAFSDGKETIVMVVIDSCMVPIEIHDAVKAIASEEGNIPTDHILMSATHSHSAPSCMSILGTEADANYVPFLKKKLVEAILTAIKNLQPAQIGWGTTDAADFTALRRWVIHPKFIREDPFGNVVTRATMHAATNWEVVTGPSGPEDPVLYVLSVQTTDGNPLALYANFSMHYYSAKAVSADYYGLFSNGLQERLDPKKTGFVAMMSHGCSGDIWRHDYEKSPSRGDGELTLEQYSDGMIENALKAIKGITYERPESIAMTETRMTLQYRVPDKQRLEWAQRIDKEIGDRLPKTQTEVYAREAIYLDAKKETETLVQGIRLGDKIGIATMPTETYAITGLKIKAASPLPHTMVVELANSADGYIPPPEQHLLGGYNAQAARSAGLEVNAEPILSEAAIQALEKVAGKQRTDRRAKAGPAVEKVLARNPRAYWRFDEFSGPRAVDSSPNGLDAIYEPRVLFYLPGPQDKAFATGGQNRSVFLAGDRISARVPGIGDKAYTLSFWIWSGTAKGVMDGTEWIFSRGSAFGPLSKGDHVGLRENSEGVRTLVYEGAGTTVSSKANHPIERWQWHHVVVARSGGEVRLYLDGAPAAKTSVSADSGAGDSFYLGGSSTGNNNFEGRLDEAAMFDRALDDAEIAAMYQEAAGK